MRSAFSLLSVPTLLAAALFVSSSALADDAVVVELFTSQGCSSCPPADRLLSQLGQEAGDVEIIPLSFHVDYWNYIGWKDEFSSPKWSKRQKRYSSLMSDRTYTPQLVVQGSLDCVGSNEHCVRAAVDRIRTRRSVGQVEVRRVREVAGSVHVEAVARLERSAPNAVATVVIYESGLSTEVRRGENRGRQLRNDFVVRTLQEVGAVPAGDTALRQVVARIPIRDEWKTQNLGAVVFLQAPETLRVLAAGRSEIEREMAALDPLPKAMSKASKTVAAVRPASPSRLFVPTVSVFEPPVHAGTRQKTTESLGVLTLQEGKPWFFLNTERGSRMLLRSNPSVKSSSAQ